MILMSRCANEFAHVAQVRGMALFQQRKVVLESADNQTATATVAEAGRSSYHVTLDWQAKDEGILFVRCDCEVAKRRQPCAHVWATIAAVDVTGKTKSIAENDIGDEASDWIIITNNPHPQAGPPDAALTTSQVRWRQQLTSFGYSMKLARPGWNLTRAGVGAQLWYVFNIGRSVEARKFCVEVWRRETDDQTGTVQMTPFALYPPVSKIVLDEVDQRVVSFLQMFRYDYQSAAYRGYANTGTEYVHCALVPWQILNGALPTLADTGRLTWMLHDGSLAEQPQSLGWDGQKQWRLKLQFLRDDAELAWQMVGLLVAGHQEFPVSEVRYVGEHGVALLNDRFIQLNSDSDIRWLSMLYSQSGLSVPYGDEDDFVETLWSTGSVPECDFPEELRWQRAQAEPKPRLRVQMPDGVAHLRSSLPAFVCFTYGGVIVQQAAFQRVVADRDHRCFYQRDFASERNWEQSLHDLGVPEAESYESSKWVIPVGRFPELAQRLILAGWDVEAEGGLIRQSGQIRITVQSGMDWFDMEAECDFEGQVVKLPTLLAALKRGDRFVKLGDGTQGMLPTEWLAKFAGLTEFGDTEGDAVRFRPSQAMLLDALLAAQQATVQFDERFGKIINDLKKFTGIRPVTPPKSFSGELRQYQEQGLGWLSFLQRFSLGGCLADDMGLGKTVQVLALLESRRSRRLKKGETRRPSLVVVPRSLVFNWLEEAHKFAPKLRMMDYTGTGRQQRLSEIHNYDCLVTTYASMRLDIERLRDFEFDYVILDEAQAIKNSGSLAAKASRLLQANHRLAMTGTPVENHLGELWSIFEFLNPGMLGTSTVFQKAAKETLGPHIDPFDAVSPLNNSASTALAIEGNVGAEPAGPTSGLKFIAEAVKPFILRRTKAQVLTELPEKYEQTLVCEMSPGQRRLYNELRDYYRAALAKKIEADGLMKSKMHVLEALLRLRQAACHPALLNAKKKNVPSAKLDTLLEHVTEIIDGGHKALVFSQFTSLLTIVRRELDRRKIVYEYSDGQTKDRQRCVERFQTSSKVKLFLISLKAGGHGLNLTAADYVYILDPWWNPAVEAQAVDRAHRWGQTNRVFAYRLICKDTVEEKIVELQQRKRELADAIITADSSFLQELTADDLQRLLS
ncbi:MAG: DEAD/DEAH box helicase [Planctomycetales bacterium]|nr:DEAD/DEAH box helicase [Planctomycetales bacterium]